MIIEYDFSGRSISNKGFSDDREDGGEARRTKTTHGTTTIAAPRGKNYAGGVRQGRACLGDLYVAVFHTTNCHLERASVHFGGKSKDLLVLRTILNNSFSDTSQDQGDLPLIPSKTRRESLKMTGKLVEKRGAHTHCLKQDYSSAAKENPAGGV